MTATIDLSYQRKSAIRSIFTLRAGKFAFQGIEAAIRLRKQLRTFVGNKWFHILAAGFQVSAGIQIGRACAESKLETIIWGSDHCVITRAAILTNESTQKHFFLPHGPCIGATNNVRDRSIFDHIYALNGFQKAVFLEWEPSLDITLLDTTPHTPVVPPEPTGNKPFVLFLNQLDLGLKPNDGFSSELEQFLTQLNPANLLGIVVKNQRQLDKFNTRFKAPKHYFGFADFSSAQPPGSAICSVFSSSVSIDLMLTGYDLALSPGNPLVEDNKARQLLGIPDPSSWNDTFFYHVRFNLDELENKHA